HPTACFGFYDSDPWHLNMYRKMASDEADFKIYLEQWVFSLKRHEEYLDKVGMEAILAIKANPVIGYAPGLNRK
ncbi:MAG: CoA transferase subunit A, partial [Syntrophorhabdaceae bacterium]